MMRRDLVAAVQALLAQTGRFADVLGLGADTPEFPLARVWINGLAQPINLDTSPEARIDLRIAVQIEAWPAKDSRGDTIDGPLYDLVDAAFKALHGHKLPGRGSQALIVYDYPGMQSYSNDGPAVYTMQVSARVMPQHFSLTV